MCRLYFCRDDVASAFTADEAFSNVLAPNRARLDEPVASLGFAKRRTPRGEPAARHGHEYVSLSCGMRSVVFYGYPNGNITTYAYDASALQ